MKRESAAVPYDPDDDVPSLMSPELTQALAAAEERLVGRGGVLGVGIGDTESGATALIVYLRSAADAEGIPPMIAGIPVVTSVSGSIDAQ